MALREDDVGAIIAAFARAAIDPGEWMSALSLMSEAAGANGCALEFADLNTGSASMETTFPFDANVLKLYEERIFHINPRVRRAQMAPVGRVVDDRYLLPPDDPHTGEFLDWLSNTPNRCMQGAKIFDNGGHQIYFGSHFSSAHGPPESWQTKLHAHVVPHLVNFIAIGRRLSAEKLRNQLVTRDAFETDRSFGLLDRAGRLIECSQGFETILRTSKVLSLHNRRLVAVHAQHRPLVELLLQSTLSDRRLLEPPLPIRLVTPDAPRGIVMRSMPLAPEGTIFDIFRPAALLTLTDLDQPYRVKRDELVALFGLTRREADVAALICEGRTVERAASELSIGQYTVRQHLKAVFGKMAIERQSDLVALVARISG